ncbi:hypothetical protein LEP1GSC008_4597 [Leptospira kirschneri serovar Bulgarica str. Nikolaevo]|uniref:Uncharacterized protein n=1 Tax=Leptospira kirschneri serovar Bulgarica str. Nikolaevo TaxID=1240687 RepID=M6FB76_9LEPT|nr:hypothetical protein LEP1GSC008_4597 [Leptospira kirschneri serovar Bulgarica str. Nikolaevo]
MRAFLNSRSCFLDSKPMINYFRLKKLLESLLNSIKFKYSKLLINEYEIKTVVKRGKKRDRYSP